MSRFESRDGIEGYLQRKQIKLIGFKSCILHMFDYMFYLWTFVLLQILEKILPWNLIYLCYKIINKMLAKDEHVEMLATYD